jgi:hypothetical protein
MTDDMLKRLKQAIVYLVCEPTDDKTDLDILSQLHTDVISRAQFKWAQSLEETRECLAKKQEAIAEAHRREMLFIGGVTVSALYLKNNKGTNLLTPEELAALATRGADNELVELGGYYHGCINNPAYFEYVRRYVHVIIDGGVDGLHFDEADSRWFHHRPYECFCDYCNAGLRARLQARYTPAELADRFQIEDIEHFDYRAYLQSHGWVDCPGKSPLHGEWWLFQLEACRERFIALLEDAQAYTQARYGRRLVNTANVYDPLWLPERGLESPYIEYVMIGSCLELRLRDGDKQIRRDRLPPQYSYIPLHRITRSQTPDRPVTFFIDWPPGALFMDAQPLDVQKNILKYLFAEAYACGVYLNAPYKSCYARWVGPLDMLIQYTSFFARERERFLDTQPVALVGVLYSYASSIWDHFPLELARSSAPVHALQYYGLGQALLDAGIPYDGLFVGDGNVLPNTLTMADLARYELVIVPCWYALHPDQVDVLATYAAHGGHLLVLGPWAQHGPQGELLDSAALSARLEGAGAVIMPERTPDWEAYLNQPAAGTAARHWLVQQVEMLVGRALRVEMSGANLIALLTRSNNGANLHVHLINRELTVSGYVRYGNLPLKVPLPRGIHVQNQLGQLVSPDDAGSTVVPVVVADGQISLTLPQIDTYVVLTVALSKS